MYAPGTCFPHGVMYAPPHYPEQGYYMQSSLQYYQEEEEEEAIAQLEHQVLEVEDTLRACSRGRSRAARRHLAQKQRAQQEVLALREASRLLQERNLELRGELDNSRHQLCEASRLLQERNQELDNAREEVRERKEVQRELEISRKQMREALRKEAQQELEISRKEACEALRKEAQRELEISRKEAQRELEISRKEVAQLREELIAQEEKLRKDQEYRSRNEARKEVEERRESDEAALLRASLQTSQELRLELDTLKESSGEAVRLCEVYTAENEILRQLCRQQHRRIEQRRCDMEEMQRTHVVESAKNVKKLVAMTELCRRMRLQLASQEPPAAK
jgi:hypothetical protein